MSRRRRPSVDMDIVLIPTGDGGLAGDGHLYLRMGDAEREAALVDCLLGILQDVEGSGEHGSSRIDLNYVEDNSLM